MTITCSNHGLITGQAVYIQNINVVSPTTLWTVTKLNDNQFTLAAVSGSVSIVSGTTAELGSAAIRS